MTKAEQFLWIVQTVMIQNAVNLASSDKADEYRHEISATGAFMNCDEAVRASEMIPETKSAAEAAHEFCFYMLSNLRDADEKAASRRAIVPMWFARN